MLTIIVFLTILDFDLKIKLFDLLNNMDFDNLDQQLSFESKLNYKILSVLNVKNFKSYFCDFN